jgi:hypothetical protein
MDLHQTLVALFSDLKVDPGVCLHSAALFLGVKGMERAVT